MYTNTHWFRLQLRFHFFYPIRLGNTYFTKHQNLATCAVGTGRRLLIGRLVVKPVRASERNNWWSVCLFYCITCNDILHYYRHIYRHRLQLRLIYSNSKIDFGTNYDHETKFNICLGMSSYPVAKQTTRLPLCQHSHTFVSNFTQVYQK